MRLFAYVHFNSLLFLTVSIDPPVCSATYSNKYVDGGVISPNLSRRRLYTHDSLKDSPSAR